MRVPAVRKIAHFASICSLVTILDLSPVMAEGKFIGNPITRWEDDGRSMTLAESFEYIDPNGRRWRVPEGVRVDGASIPSIFWSLIGGPFEGKYRNSSIIHDYFCDIRKRRWQDVHKMFYDGMLTSGVARSKAYLMYKAVEEFGPRWAEPKVDQKCVLPNGKFNYSRCIEDSAIVSSKIFVPPAGRKELHAFVEEMKAVASPEDIEKLRAIADRAK